MKTWAFVLGAVAAAGIAAAVVSVALHRAGVAASGDEIPALLEDCFERIHSIEAELHRLSPNLQPAE